MKDKLHKVWHYLKPKTLKKMWKQTLWIYQYGRRYWKSMVLYTVFGLIGSGVSLTSSLLSKDLVDIITGHESGRLLQVFAMTIGLSIANILITQASSYVSTFLSLKVDTEIKNDIFTKMLITDWESLSNYHTGDLVTRWNSDASTIASGILNWIPNLIIYTVRFLCALAVVLYYDPTFALFALLGIPFSALLSKPLLRRMRSNNERSAAMSAKLYGFHQETFSNIQTIKAFDLIHLYTNKLKSLQAEYIHMRLDFQKMSIVTSILLSVIGFIVSYSCYGWGIYRVWTNAITYGTMTMFLSLSGTLTTTVNALVNLIPSAISLMISAGRLMEIVEMPREDFSQDNAVTKFHQEHQEEGIGLFADHLFYSYQNGKEVFRDCSLEAYPHEIIALVGPSGEGKTTMLRLFLSLLTPKSGALHLCAGQNRSCSLLLSPSSRKLFSYVPQGNTMFSGTIAENLRSVKQDATDDELIDVLKQACAWEFVSQLPDGINSCIKERGGGLSEGQAQRLAIARALLHEAPILLLDEATSALDIVTERQVLRNIMSDTRPRTCIVTTHRPTVLTMCSRVYGIRRTTCDLLSETEIADLIQHF